jgi:hypothetical protein
MSHVWQKRERRTRLWPEIMRPNHRRNLNKQDARKELDVQISGQGPVVGFWDHGDEPAQ